jgi:hypothetical protein
MSARLKRSRVHLGSACRLAGYPREGHSQAIQGNDHSIRLAELFSSR